MFCSSGDSGPEKFRCSLHLSDASTFSQQQCVQEEQHQQVTNQNPFWSNNWTCLEMISLHVDGVLHYYKFNQYKHKCRRERNSFIMNFWSVWRVLTWSPRLSQLQFWVSETRPLIGLDQRCCGRTLRPGRTLTQPIVLWNRVCLNRMAQSSRSPRSIQGADHLFQTLCPDAFSSNFSHRYNLSYFSWICLEHIERKMKVDFSFLFCWY